MTKYDIIAATGCPTGIAHTYMAQEALEQAAKKAGVTLKHMVKSALKMNSLPKKSQMQKPSLLLLTRTFNHNVSSTKKLSTFQLDKELKMPMN